METPVSYAQRLAQQSTWNQERFERDGVLQISGSHERDVDGHGWIVAADGKAPGPIEPVDGRARLTYIRMNFLSLATLAQVSGDPQLRADLNHASPLSMLLAEVHIDNAIRRAAVHHLLGGVGYEEAASSARRDGVDPSEVQRAADRLRERWSTAYGWLRVYGRSRTALTARRESLARETAGLFTETMTAFLAALKKNLGKEAPALVFVERDVALMSTNRTTPDASISDVKLGALVAEAARRTLPDTNVEVHSSAVQRWPAIPTGVYTLQSRAPHHRTT